MAQMVYSPRARAVVMVARRHVNGLLGGSSVVLRLVPPRPAPGANRESGAWSGGGACPRLFRQLRDNVSNSWSLGKSLCVSSGNAWFAFFGHVPVLP